jgi:hypothetical protein
MIEVDWRVAFIDYIQEYKLSPSIDPKSVEATHILRRSKGYVLVGGVGFYPAAHRGVYPRW